MVTVCKYFLTNSCRYGDKCRYSHVLPSENYNSNPYVYNARQRSEGISVMQRFSSQQNSSPHSVQHVDDVNKLMPEYLKKIAEDVNQIEHQQMWPLTCYSFLKSHGNFPGWNDISMEEVRWEAYQAHANGVTHIYLSKMQELLAHAKELRNIFLRPSPQAESIVRDYMKGIKSTSANSNENVPFTLNQHSNALSSFSFASAFEKSQASVFDQMPNASSSGFFSQAMQPNAFSQIPPTQQSFFGGKSFETPQNDIFKSSASQNQPPVMEMSNSIFGSSDQQQHFGSVSSSRQGLTKLVPSETTSPTSVNVTVYSKVEDLSKEDYDAYKATTFTLENLPFAPPPKELCL